MGADFNNTNKSAAISSRNLLNPKILRIARLVLSGLVFYSVVMRCVYSWNSDIPAMLYFTILTNLGCGLFWLFEGLFPNVKTDTASLLVTTYAALTGIIFIFLLDYGFIDTIYTKLELGEITDTIHYYAMTISSITHYIVPFLMLVDFLVFTDVRKLKPNRALTLAYPLCYFVVAIGFALATGQYVYPFFDPGFVGGWGVVALISAGILCVILLINSGLYRLNKKVQLGIERYYRSVLETAEEKEPESPD